MSFFGLLINYAFKLSTLNFEQIYEKNYILESFIYIYH